MLTNERQKINRTLHTPEILQAVCLENKLQFEVKEEPAQRGLYYNVNEFQIGYNFAWTQKHMNPQKGRIAQQNRTWTRGRTSSLGSTGTKRKIHGLD